MDALIQLFVSVTGSGSRCEAGGFPSQAHLLALLTHQASWETLASCLTYLLQPDRVAE